MDVNMPILDGLQATKIIKEKCAKGELYNDMFIIITTALDKEDEKKVFL